MYPSEPFNPVNGYSRPPFGFTARVFCNWCSFEFETHSKAEVIEAVHTRAACPMCHQFVHINPSTWRPVYEPGA